MQALAAWVYLNPNPTPTPTPNPNPDQVRLLARSLRTPAHLEGVAALRELLAAQVVPHLESVG